MWAITRCQENGWDGSIISIIRDSDKISTKCQNSHTGHSKYFPKWVSSPTDSCFVVFISFENISFLYFSYALVLPGVLFTSSEWIPFGWYHLVFNYIGTSGTQGIVFYHDGHEVTSSTSGQTLSTSAGPGEVVIGRYLTTLDGGYSSVLVDELLFFNHKLSQKESQILYNMNK